MNRSVLVFARKMRRAACAKGRVRRLLINGRVYLYSSVEVRVNGVRFPGVVSIRCQADGSRCFQFSQVIKHNGETFYWADSTECVS